MAATHVLDIYGVHLHLATTKPEWKKLRRTLTWLDKTPDYMGLTSFAVWEPKKTKGPSVPHLVVWVDVERHEPFDLVDTIAHEASHGAGRILSWVGHNFDGTDEPHAYLVGWLSRWIYEGCSLTEPTTK